jgi:hypothetical protein
MLQISRRIKSSDVLICKTLVVFEGRKVKDFRRKNSVNWCIISQSIGHLPDDFQAFINMGIRDFGKYLMQKEREVMAPNLLRNI